MADFLYYSIVRTIVSIKNCVNKYLVSKDTNNLSVKNGAKILVLINSTKIMFKNFSVKKCDWSPVDYFVTLNLLNTDFLALVF